LYFASGSYSERFVVMSIEALVVAVEMVNVSYVSVCTENGVI
jgi:hypothetical protein